MITKSGLLCASTVRIRFSTARYRTVVVALRPIRLVTTRWQSTDSSVASSSDLEGRRWTSPQNGIFSTCYIPSPSTTKPSTVIEKLPRLLDTDPKEFCNALFLVTPGVAKWFGAGSGFHQDAVNHVMSPILSRTSQIESWVAVVDALPAPECFQDEDRVEATPRLPLEGIALCLRTKHFACVEKAQDSPRQSVLRIRSSRLSPEMVRKVQTPTGHLDDTDIAYSIVTVPLANTLFINGSRNTAFRQKWKATEDGSSLCPQHSARNLEEILVVTLYNDKLRLDQNVPLYPLTNGREVLSSMGNVVREVRGDDGKPLRASTELEAIVPKMLAKQKELDVEIQLQIFAKVMPPKQNDAALNRDESSTSPAFKIGEGFDKVSYTEISAAVRQQGHFYRVTSGGGGWGKKAGLLSLDPATNFVPLKDTETSMFPDLDDLDSSPEATGGIGALVPAGHSIQFFAAQVQQARSHGAVGTRAEKLQSNAAFHQILIGTLPSSDTVQSSDATNEAKNIPPFVLPNCFGALSEGGASVSCDKLVQGGGLVSRQEGKSSRFETVNEFRVDVPHATFRISLPLPTKASVRKPSAKASPKPRQTRIQKDFKWRRLILEKPSRKREGEA